MAVIASCNDPLSLVFLLIPPPHPPRGWHSRRCTIFPVTSPPSHLTSFSFPLHPSVSFLATHESPERLENSPIGRHIHFARVSTASHRRWEGQRGQRGSRSSIQFGRSTIARLFKCRWWQGEYVSPSKTNLVEIKRRYIRFTLMM